MVGEEGAQEELAAALCTHQKRRQTGLLLPSQYVSLLTQLSLSNQGEADTEAAVADVLEDRAEEGETVAEDEPWEARDRGSTFGWTVADCCFSRGAKCLVPRPHRAGRRR